MGVLAVGEMLNLISKDGVLGFFAGAKVRTVWMTIGGIVYWSVSLSHSLSLSLSHTHTHTFDPEFFSFDIRTRYSWNSQKVISLF